MQMQQKADFDQIIIVRPKLIKQTNDDDCGLFVLHYLEKIFGSVDCYTQLDSWNSLDEQWFLIEEVRFGFWVDVDIYAV